MGVRLGLLVLGVLLPACGVGDGTGAVTGSVFLNECELKTTFGSQAAPVAFDLKPTYFVADPILDDFEKANPINRVNIRVQSRGNRIEEADGVIIQVADVGLAATAVGQPIPLGPDTNVRASLNLLRTCPAASVGLELDGSITFSRFGAAQPGAAVSPRFEIFFGDTLTATFSADIVDRRALTLGGVDGVPVAPQAGGHLDGNFDFVVRQGRGAQAL